jgi:adenine-specific DNA-methyltransferase
MKNKFEYSAIPEQIRNSKTRPYFLWKLNFFEVFQEKGGFDVIIANPPYIKEYVNRNAFNGLRSSPYYQGKMDIWYLFVCKSIDLLNKNKGTLTFIAQNNWVTSFGASKMRTKVVEDTQILKMIDFGSFKIFESAGIQTMIMIFESDRINDNYQFDFRRLTGERANFIDILDLLACNKNVRTEHLKPIIKRSDFINKNLTFSNSTFEVILNKVYSQRNFQLDEKKEVAQGIVCPQDYVNKASRETLGNGHKVNDGIFILNDKEKRALTLTDKESELIKPLYTTKELFKYYGNSKNREWIIYTDSRFNKAKNIQPYTNIKDHLDRFRKVITSDNKPYGLHRARDEYFFRGEKIISVRKCTEPVFTYTSFDCYVTATFYVIKSERINLKYLTALLNSKLLAFWLKHKGKMQGNNYQIDKEPILDIPIKEGSVVEQKSLVEVIGKIINDMQGNDYMQNSVKQAKVKEYERQIDQMIYKLYGLSKEEIEIVENSKKGKNP